MIPAEPIHPGEYVQDEIEERGVTVAQLAHGIGVSVDQTEMFLARRGRVCEEMARRLALFFGTNEELWLNLQLSYDKACDTQAKRLLRKFKRMRRDIHQLIVDLEWWNNNRTEHPPFDIESDRLALAKLDKCIACVEERRPIPDDLWNEFSQHLEEAADMRQSLRRE